MGSRAAGGWRICRSVVRSDITASVDEPRAAPRTCDPVARGVAVADILAMKIVRHWRAALKRNTVSAVSIGAVLSSLACGATNTVAPTPGALVVQIEMSGTDVPAAGVTVTVDALTPVKIEAGSYSVFPLLTPGEHQVAVSGVAANCTSSQPLTQQTRIRSNTVDSLAFVFACSTAPLDAHGIIAFARGDTTGFDDIWVMNSDGTGEIDLTNSPNVADEFPSWPSDGAHIIFLTHGESTPQIAIMNRDGSGLTTITNDPRQKTSPAVSPDGSRVAFSVADSANFLHIWVVNVDGSDLVQLTMDTVVDDHPAWSPDGTKIVFGRRVTPEISYLVVMNADGSNAQRLSPDTVYDANPSWSPDGAHIAFARGLGGQEHVGVMNTDGSNFMFLTSNGGPDDGPSWSGDGSKIAFTSARGGSFGIWTMQADGVGLQQITPPSTINDFPAWSK